MNVEKDMPYEVDYNTLGKWRKFRSILFIITMFCPIIFVIFEIFSIFEIPNYLQIIYIISLFLYYVVNIYTEIFLSPDVEWKRREGLIDNSFGSNLLEKNVKGYYSNDKISYGIYKMAINYWENCFFSLNISKEKTNKIIIKNLILLVIVVLFAYYGFKNNKLGVQISQLLLSPLFLLELAYHLKFRSNLQKVHDEFKHLFSKIKDENIVKDEKIKGEMLLICINYEVSLAYNKSSSIDSKIYEKLNEKLTKEWEEIKKRYLNIENN